ncbi:WD repeat-containing protein 97 [Xiphias gladius]|uniref:WD repeat-containing protein 97 n=1 Tax=Xiphias gladius TaxID=8245 RepID=UPI001A9887B4|nr:WD repeat-containing protein 97 [Xiphias gladius]
MNNIGASRTDSTAENEEEESPAVAANQLLTEDKWKQKEYESLVASNMDLSALVQGTVKCKKGKPSSTKQTRKEAFDRYMKIIYGLPPNIEIDFEDTSDPDTFSFYPEPDDNKPCNPPPLKEHAHPESKLIVPVTVEIKKEKKAPASNSRPKTLMKVKPRSVRKVIPEKPIIVEKDEEPPEIISPIETPKTPAPPPPGPRTPTPLPPREPNPEVPRFLKQLTDAGLFRDLFPDKERIPSTLSPDDFSLQLLGYLNTCSTPSKIKTLVALQALHRQGLLQNTDKLYQGLTDLMPKFARAHMSPLERTVLVEKLDLLMHLKSASYDLVKKLLTLLAFKELVLRETVLRILTELGVDEAEQWLWPELESWDSELQHQSDIWKSLHDRAECWLELWISKYKEHNRRSSERPSMSHLLVTKPLSSQPIFRLGETYSMARTRKPPGLILPPLRNRPFLMNFPNLISFPLSRVTLCPFHIYSDEDWLKASPRRYFIQQQSYVEYYR